MTISTSSKLALIFGAVMLVWGSVNAARASEKITFREFAAMAPAFQSVYMYPCGETPKDRSAIYACVDGFASSKLFTIKISLEPDYNLVSCHKENAVEIPCTEVIALASGI